MQYETDLLTAFEGELIMDPNSQIHNAGPLISKMLSPEVRRRLEVGWFPVMLPTAKLAASSTPSDWELGRGMLEAYANLGANQLMPLLGFGTGIFYTDPREAIRFAAAELGYRHFDCAQNYGNEEVVGIALRDSGIPRRELFIATKQGKDFGAESTTHLFHDQLKKLGVEYLDLYMFHGIPDNQEQEKGSWQALEKLHAFGKVRALGLSNYDREAIERILSFAQVKPVYLQIKFSVYSPGYQHAHEEQFELVSWAQSQGLVVVGYSTMSGWPFPLRSSDDPHVQAISAGYRKSAGQILLRHSLQRGLAVIPSSANNERLKENTLIFDFQISDEDMLCLDALAHFVSIAEDSSPKWIPDVYNARKVQWRPRSEL